ncbi:MAG TPA: hypothetical protein PKO20_07095, partial [Clostridiales bacterium]|nr:hypothetical protein [Clostridiales bacterium]
PPRWLRPPIAPPAAEGMTADSQPAVAGSAVRKVSPDTPARRWASRFPPTVSKRRQGIARQKPQTGGLKFSFFRINQALRKTIDFGGIFGKQAPHKFQS